MEVARDLQDRQLVDRDDEPCGRVDDILIEWNEVGARLGPLLSGPGMLLSQLGTAGRLVKRIPLLETAQRYVTIEWRQVRALEPHRLCLLPARDCLDARRACESASLEGQLLLTQLLQRTVIDSRGEEMGILDLRTGNAKPPAAPHIAGLLCAPDPKLLLFGLKRHDGGLLPRRRAARRARFVPWDTITSIDPQSLLLDRPFEEYPRLADTTDAAPPSLPSSEEGA